MIDYWSSSDNVDSDRTARAVVDHGRARTNVSTSTRSSRRPSLSTTASSGRTRLTNLSSATSGVNSLTLSGGAQPGGGRYRDTTYYSKRDQEDDLRARRQFEANVQRERAIHEYQRERSGGMEGPELTAENIRQSQMRRTGSASQSGRSVRSHRSSKSRVVPGEGVEIKSGNTIINVTGDSTLSFTTGEDGARRVVIDGAAVASSASGVREGQSVRGAASVVSVGGGGGSGGKGREKEYLGSGSRSSSSRVGRSRGGSEVDGGGGSRVGRGRKRDSIQEEVGMEGS